MSNGGRPAAAVIATIALVAGGVASGSSAQADGPGRAAVADDGEATPADRPVTFHLGLDRDSSALWRAARLASTPGSSGYRQFVTLRESGRRYGASAGTIAGLRAEARRLGMTIAVDPSGLFARATAPAQVWSTIYASPLTTLRRGDLLLTAPRSVTDNVVAAEAARGAGDVFGAAPAGPPIPGVLRPFVTAVIPMSVETSLHASAPQGEEEDVLDPESDLDPTFPTIPTNSGTPGRSCLPGPGSGSLYSTVNTYTPRQLHTAYGTRALHEAGLTGRGARMTILSTTAVPRAPLEFAARCFGYPAPTLEMTLVSGAGRDLSGDSQEVLLDVQTAAAVLPGASSVRVVQAPLTPSGLDFLLWSVTSLAAALDATGDGGTSPDVVSMSVGLCRTLVDAIEATTGSAGALELAEDLLATAALVGTGVFASSGDAGSSDCARLGRGYTWQETEWPASSKWVTAVGGTLLEVDRDNRRSTESVWNDDRLLPGMEGLGGAGGGPTSGNAPWYQAAATPRDRRVVPDLVAHASGLVGWPVAVCSDSPCGESAEMTNAGGTSASTPFVAATFALMSAGERSEGRPPLGFVNPWIYRLGADGTGFYDIAVGDNAIAPGVACCVATRGFDQASGLGAPRFRQIAARIPPPGR